MKGGKTMPDPNMNCPDNLGWCTDHTVLEPVVPGETATHVHGASQSVAGGEITVEVTLADVGDAPPELHVSRTGGGEIVAGTLADAVKLAGAVWWGAKTMVEARIDWELMGEATTDDVHEYLLDVVEQSLYVQTRPQEFLLGRNFEHAVLHHSREWADHMAETRTKFRAAGIDPSIDYREAVPEMRRVNR